MFKKIVLFFVFCFAANFAAASGISSISRYNPANVSITGGTVDSVDITNGTINGVNISSLYIPLSAGWGSSLTASRVVGTLYTNSSPYPLYISCVYGMTTFLNAQIQVDGVTVQSVSNSNASIVTGSMFTIVPAGGTYKYLTAICNQLFEAH